MSGRKEKQDQEKPGKQLQRLREERDITVDIVADQLRLDRKMILALENDDYDQFPATTYIRGYIRGYTKYLGIDSAPFIRAFDQYAGDEPQLTPFVSQPEPQVKSGDKHMRLITYGVIAVLLLSLGYWWKNWQIDPEAIVTLGEPSEKLTAQIEQESQSHQPFLGGSDRTDQQATLSNIGPSVNTERSSDFVHEFDVVDFSEEQSVTDIIVDRDNLEQEEITKEEIIEKQPLDVTPVPEEGQPLPDIATFEAEQQKGSGIVVELQGVSWIQISDTNDIRVYSGLAGPDESINVNGEAPFRVVIGKTTAVTSITYAESEIDLEPLTIGDVARFFVDQSGAYR